MAVPGKYPAMHVPERTLQQHVLNHIAGGNPAVADDHHQLARMGLLILPQGDFLLQHRQQGGDILVADAQHAHAARAAP